MIYFGEAKFDSSQINFVKVQRQKLPYEIQGLFAITFSKCLQECVDELIIIGKSMNLPKITMNLDYLSLKRRYDSVNINEEYSDAYIKKRKFQQDRTYLEMALKRVIFSLTNYCNYKNLVDLVTDYKITKDDDETLLKTNKLKTKQFNKLKDSMKKQKKFFNNNFNHINNSVKYLNNNIAISSIENEYKISYVEEWQNSMVELLDRKLMEIENKIQKELDYYKVKIQQETRIHNEITTYIELVYNENIDELDKWITKYDNDMDVKDSEIVSLKMEIDKQKQNYEQIKLLYEQRQVEIRLYLNEKEKKQMEKMEMEKRTKAAIKIQAWWRGVMFRKGLGPYKRKKKPKGKKLNVSKTMKPN